MTETAGTVGGVPEVPKHAARRVARALVVVALATGVTLGGALAFTLTTARGRVLTVSQAPAREVAIIFGAETYPDGRPSPYLRARLDLGVALYKAGKAKTLIVSGDDSDAHNRETSSMKRYLVAAGVPEAAVVEDRFGFDTYATCARAKRVFGVADALLVSQRYHLHRAVATCRALGVDAIGVGDASVKRTSGRWREFQRREVLANLKMVWDLVSRREPVLER